MATFLVPSCCRPHWLRRTLLSIRRSKIPPEWRLEIVCCLPRGDDGIGVADTLADRVAIVNRPHIGEQHDAALDASTGELILVSGDDDLQSPYRLAHAVRAYEAGHAISGLAQFYFWREADEQLAWWQGPPSRCGATMSYHADFLRIGGGWHGRLRNLDWEVRKTVNRISGQRHVARLPAVVGRSTVCCELPEKISISRPFPEKGKTVQVGCWTIVGRGHASLFEVEEISSGSV